MLIIVRLVASGLLAVGTTVTVITAPDKGPDRNPPGHHPCKPGHGYGDAKHPHCGPPGHRPCPPGHGYGDAKQPDCPPPGHRPCKPGHGHGDAKRPHCGPPGHDRPGGKRGAV